jgi:C1A family cysteine protease
MPPVIKRYGWLPDAPDPRDKLYEAPTAALQSLPAQADLRAQCPPVYNQGDLGSCTANAIAGALEFLQMQERLPQVFVPSRLFIYYNERAMEGTIETDSGAQIRDGIKSVATQGAPPESLWPYDPAFFAVQPPAEAYQTASQYKAILYMRLAQSLEQLKGCLASGYPFVFGIVVYESFESATVEQTGQVPMPLPGEVVVGRHAVMAVGYDDSAQTFLTRNSWGATWGMQGYFTLPYAYLASNELASDFWTIRVVQ